MTMSKHSVTIAIASLGLAAILTYADAGQSLKIDFSDETVGGEPKSFVSVVGVWRIESDGGNKVLVVDGRQWKEGQTAAGIADKARTLYGDRYGISRPRSGLCLFSLCGGQGCDRSPRRRDLRALRGDFRPHRPRRGDLVQPQ